MRIGFDAPDGLKSISPLPKSFSAPALSKMVLESTCDETANEIRLGIFALIRPVHPQKVFALLQQDESPQLLLFVLIDKSHLPHCPLPPSSNLSAHQSQRQ